VRFHRQIPHTETKRIREMPWRRAVLSGIHMLADGDRTAGSGGSIRTSAWRHQKSSIELIRKLQKPMTISHTWTCCAAGFRPGPSQLRVIFVGSTRSRRSRNVRFAPIASETRHRSEGRTMADSDVVASVKCGDILARRPLKPSLKPRAGSTARRRTSSPGASSPRR
jgi:hypothetical protein